MLLRLYGSNFRSLKDDFELSMIAADLRNPDDCGRGVMEVEIEGLDEPLKVLRTVAIFGHNASGKSTVLMAAHALHWLIDKSSERSKPDADIPPYEPFRLDNATRNAPVTLGCDVVFQNKILRYEVSYTATVIEREILSLTGEETDTLIDRSSSKNVAGSLIDRSDANKLYVKEMQPNVLVLSKLAQHGPAEGKDSVRPYYQAILDVTRGDDYATSSAAGTRLGDPFPDNFEKHEKYRHWIMKNLMVAADVGIESVEFKRRVAEYPDFIRKLASENPEMELPKEEVEVSFVHRGKDSVAIDMVDESAGTRKIFNIARDWWQLAHKKISLFADELSASLHPNLLDALVRAVNDASDDVRSQLIFATHDAGLLEGRDGKPPALRRDQVYFTKKDSNGESTLYSLAEFKDQARPVHNIRKRYLSGLYNAIPLVEKISL